MRALVNAALVPTMAHLAPAAGLPQRDENSVTHYPPGRNGIAKKIAVAIFALAVAACAYSPYRATTPTAEEQRFISSLVPNYDRAKAAVVADFQRNLKDPESARYRFPGRLASGAVQVYGTRYAGFFMCGFVNAKNSFGGYTGDQEFIAHLRGGEIVDFLDVGGPHQVGYVWRAETCSALYRGNEISGR